MLQDILGFTKGSAFSWFSILIHIPMARDSVTHEPHEDIVPSQIGEYEQVESSITGNMLQTSGWEMLLLGNDWMGSRVSGEQQTSNGSLVRWRLPIKKEIDGKLDIPQRWNPTRKPKDIHR